LPTSSPKKDRRTQPRRAADRATEDLFKTFSTHYCHSCIERVGDAVLLLDNQGRLLYATSQMHSIISGSNKLFTLTPSFTLFNSKNNSRIGAFFNNNNNQVEPLVLQLINEKDQDQDQDQDLLLLSCFRLPQPSSPNLHTASFLIKLRKTEEYSDHQWLFFAEQFTLTQAEIRLCRALMGGLTLNDCSINWNISSHTTRSQLKTIFSKTSSRRQTDLLRLIHLFFQA